MVRLKIRENPGVSEALDTEIGVARCFGTADINRAGLELGWAEPEEAHNWNEGPHSMLMLSAPLPGIALDLVIEGSPLIAGPHPRQDITLFVNGWRLGFWRLTDSAPARLRARVEPAHWLVNGGIGRLNLAWHLPDSLRLSTLEADGDDRELGFCFRTIALLPQYFG